MGRHANHDAAKQLLSSIWLCALLLPAGFVSQASAERLPATAFTMTDGLPHRVVSRIVADSRGFLWVCSRRGLSRFDGGRFFTYGSAEGLAVPSVNDFLQTSRGDYWVATNGGGACRLNTSPISQIARDASRFSHCAQGTTPEAARVNRLHEDRAGRIWAGTDGGLFRLIETEGQPRLEPVALDLPSHPDRALQIWAFAEDPSGALWMGTSAGLAKRVERVPATHYPIQPMRGLDHVYALLIDRHRQVWIGHERGLVIFRDDDSDATGSRVRQLRLKQPPSVAAALPVRPGEAVRFSATEGLPSQLILALHQTGEKETWIGTSRGLVRFDGKRFVTVTVGGPVQHVSAITDDRSRHVWMAGVGGVVRLDRAGFISYTEADGLADGLIRSVFENRDGDLHVVSGLGVVHRFDRRRFLATLPARAKYGRTLETVVPALQDRAGEWWIAGDAGLHRFPRTARTEELFTVPPKAIFTTEDGLAGDDIFRLFEDSRGDIWIARRAPTRAILTRWDRATETFHRYLDIDGLPAFSRPIAFGEDRAGNVWVGFWGGGIARHRGGRFDFFTSADGAPAGSITAIYSHADGRLWIGSAGGGLGRVDDVEAARPRFIRYTTADGLASDAVYAVTADRSNRIYLAMFAGIDRLDPSSGLIRHYPLPDNLRSTQATAAYRDGYGTLWFGTETGLVSLIPGPDDPTAPPSMFIGGLRVSGEPYPVSELGDGAIPEIELAARQNHLQIDFFSISAEAPVRYQYKLEGADRDWTRAVDVRSVTFPSLSPGRYRFLVRAISADGTSAPASVQFRILSPIWHRWWFFTGSALLLTLGGYAFHRFRLGRMLELERMRMRIATDLHDDIGSSLTQIAILSEVAERRMQGPDRAVAEPISRVSRISRELVDSMNEIVWAINPRRDRLQDLVARMRRFAADMLAGRHIALSFRAPVVQDVAIDVGVRRQAFLIFKEAIHNAVRHSRCSEVQVAVAFQSRRLIVSVVDNGDGFDGRQPAVEGHGLRSMEARARDLGGRVDVVSAGGRGTSVHLSVPLRRHRMVPGRVSDSVLSMLRVCRLGSRDISVGVVNDQISHETVATE